MAKNTNKDDKTGNIPLWKISNPVGRPPIFKEPKDFWEAALKYFEWVENNPLYEEKIFHAHGVITKDKITKMRAMTIQGLCVHMGISDECFSKYSKRTEFVGIVEHVKKCIYEQKLTGAAADLLNASIISRELGLADKVEQTVKDDRKLEVTFEEVTEESQVRPKNED